MRPALVFILLCAVATSCLAKADLPADLEGRYHALIQELRCLVCQNQNLAESNAPLAVDLKQQVADMLIDGRSDAEVKDYLLARYGDFVLYRPAFKPLTWLLWLGPFVLLAFALFTAWRLFSTSSSADKEEVVDEAALQALLKKSVQDGDKR